MIMPENCQNVKQKTKTQVVVYIRYGYRYTFTNEEVLNKHIFLEKRDLTSCGHNGLNIIKEM